MSDSLRTDGSRAIDAASNAERDEKIEQLLLTGLDHYFAARYEQAVNVWTRALFFDRSHPRARAYIERARSAMAERQRVSDELFHKGVAAFNRGDSDEAKRLLMAAIDGGVPHDEAHALLDRLGRSQETGLVAAGDGENSGTAPPAPARPAASDLVAARSTVARSRAALLALAASVAVVVAIGGYVIAIQQGLGWWSLLGRQDAPAVSAPSPIARDAAPLLPRRGELALGRARSLAARGQLHDALAALEAVRATDPEKSDADRVRAEIQRQLLGLARDARPPSVSPKQ